MMESRSFYEATKALEQIKDKLRDDESARNLLSNDVAPSNRAERRAIEAQRRRAAKRKAAIT